MRGTLVVFLCLVLLRALTGLADQMLAPLHLYLFAGGLFVPFAALQLPFGPGFLASLLGGLLCDAAAPVPFGTEMILFGAAHACLFHLRDRFPREEPVVRLWAALGANLAFYLVLSYMTVVRAPAGIRVLPRLTVDLAFSQLVVAGVAAWFFALQARALEIARAT